MQDSLWTKIIAIALVVLAAAIIIKFLPAIALLTVAYMFYLSR